MGMYWGIFLLWKSVPLAYGWLLCSLEGEMRKDCCSQLPPAAFGTIFTLMLEVNLDFNSGHRVTSALMMWVCPLSNGGSLCLPWRGQCKSQTPSPLTFKKDSELGMLRFWLVTFDFSDINLHFWRTVTCILGN